MREQEFGEYMKSLRKSAGLTLAELGEKLGLSHSYLSQIETGKKSIPSPDILKKLAELLGKNYVELMDAAGYLPDGLFEELNLKRENVSARDLPYADATPLNVKDFGEWLKEVRESGNISLSKLEELTGYPSSIFAEIEAGEHTPTPELLGKLSEPFGILYSDLLMLAGHDRELIDAARREQIPIDFGDIDLTAFREQENFMKGITDLKTFLERKVSPYLTYNGHRLNDQDRQRVLTVLGALFPEYQ
jgi:transcriptional regulator with XRE-family HTH domain